MLFFLPPEINCHDAKPKGKESKDSDDRIGAGNILWCWPGIWLADLYRKKEKREEQGREFFFKKRKTIWLITCPE